MLINPTSSCWLLSTLFCGFISVFIADSMNGQRHEVPVYEDGILSKCVQFYTAVAMSRTTADHSLRPVGNGKALPQG